MEGVKGAAELFGLPKHLVRTLALTGKVKAVRVSNGKNAKILINIQSLTITSILLLSVQMSGTAIPAAFSLFRLSFKGGEPCEYN